MAVQSQTTRRIAKVLLALLIGVIVMSTCSEHTFAASKQPRTHKVRILMIGNSLTSSKHGHISKYLQRLADAAGYNASVSYIAYGGEYLENYAKDYTERGRKVRQKIKSKKWDYIIFQQHTGHAIAYRTSTLHALQKLKKYI